MLGERVWFDAGQILIPLLIGFYFSENILSDVHTHRCYVSRDIFLAAGGPVELCMQTLVPFLYPVIKVELCMQTLVPFLYPVIKETQEPTEKKRDPFIFPVFYQFLLWWEDKSTHSYSGLQLKRSCRRKTRNDRRLGTEGYFTYCKNSVGPFLNNITSRGHIQRNWHRPWQE